MKPIIGEVVSSKPVSLAEAASILSNFISKGTGATQEMSAYLARSCAAFDELVEYHRHAKMRSGSVGRDSVIKEEKAMEKHKLKGLIEEAFEGQRLVSGDKRALRAVHAEGNGHVEASHDHKGMADEKSHRKNMKKRREHEVDSGSLEGTARLNLDAMQLENGIWDNHKAEDPEEMGHGKKKKKRDRQEEGGASSKGISEGEIEQPPKKRKKKEKVVEYEVESERNVQRH